MKTTGSLGSRIQWLLFLGIVLGMMGGWGSARAQVVDRVEVARVGTEAEVKIVFTRRMQYLRHAPLARAETLRITVQVPGANQQELQSLITEVKQSPPNDAVPPLMVSLPEPNSVQADRLVIGVRFGRMTPVRIRPSGDGLSLSIFVPALPPKPVAEPQAAPEPRLPAAPPGMGPEQVEQEAAKALAQGKEALQRGDATAAVDQLNRALNLPPNASSREAQLLIGQAREQLGETAKARAEYELYLKLYPDSPDAAMVRQRLAGLDRPAPTAVAAEPSRWQVFGSVSQYYYYGKSQVEERTVTPGTAAFDPAPDVLTQTDQSAIVSNVDLNARFRGEQTDNRIVFRDTHTYNFLKDARKKSDNRLNAAYVEQSHRGAGYLLRLGRQPGNTAGLLGRFDGAWASYALGPTWRVAGVGGVPVELGKQIDKTLYGLSADMAQTPDKVTGNVFFIEQRLPGGITDRQAVGSELRYFSANKSFLALLDYDVLFKAMNIITLIGNWQSAGGTNVFMQADNRKAPTLQMTNVQFAEQQLRSTRELVSLLGEDEVRRRADEATPDSRLFMLGFTTPVTPRWQLGADFRVTSLTSFVTCFDACIGPTTAPATGNVLVYSGQAIGSSLFRDNDTLASNISWIDARDYDAWALSLNYVLMFRDNWRLDTTLRYYQQDDTGGTTEGREDRRFTPSLRLTYRLGESLSFELEGGIEDIDSNTPNTLTGATTESQSRRHYFFAGYRWDIF